MNKVIKLVGNGVRQLVKRFWIRPLYRLSDRLAGVRPTWLKRGLQWMLTRALWLGYLVKSALLVQVVRWDGQSWSVIYIGEGNSLTELCSILCPQPAGIAHLGRAFLWQVPGLARRLADQGFLVVGELNRLFPWWPQMRCTFTSFPVVRQVIDLTEPPEAYKSRLTRDLRRRLKRIEMQGFSYEVSRRMEDFDHFYYQMYLPYVQGRYGERATITSYRLARRYFERGHLVLVRQNGHLVSGVLVYLEGQTYVATLAGVRKEFTHLARQGLTIAMYWFNICRAWQLGVSQLDLGRTRPRLGDGVFAFKRQWGSRVAPVDNIHVSWRFLAQHLNNDLCYHLNQQGFLALEDGRFWRVAVETDEIRLTEMERRRWERQAHHAGLAGLLVIRVSESQTAVQPPGCRIDYRSGQREWENC